MHGWRGWNRVGLSGSDRISSTTPTEKGFCASGAKLPGAFCLNRFVIMRSFLARGPILRCMMHAAPFDRPTDRPRPLAGDGERGCSARHISCSNRNTRLGFGTGIRSKGAEKRKERARLHAPSRLNVAEPAAADSTQYQDQNYTNNTTWRSRHHNIVCRWRRLNAHAKQMKANLVGHFLTHGLS